MAKHLVIVESPTKAKTIQPILGADFQVVSCFGHIRDLPKKKLGVIVEKNFEPEYVVPIKAKKVISDLKQAAEKAQDIILATDLDREGEAIAWHILEVLKTSKPSERIVFHAITRSAILEALKHPQNINQDLVEAQQTRRILDRLVGYKLSPFLWKKVLSGLSAGRVQSPTVRLIVEREEEIKKFKTEEYWDIEGEFSAENQNFAATLTQYRKQALEKLSLKNQKQTDEMLKNLEGQDYFIGEISEKELQKNPKPPFTTSTLQQEAANHLHFSTKKTMTLAQRLYEGKEIPGKGRVGLITYMRTDSTNLDPQALNTAREILEKKYGKTYLPETAQIYKTKSKVAQEAHEAIRPTHPDLFPEQVQAQLEPDEARLYQLIWARFLASQATKAKIKTTGLYIDNRLGDRFKASGIQMVFPGFLAIYKPGLMQEKILPSLKKDQKVQLQKLGSKQHFTEPPPRYNEASLVKTLEELGIGRPSTYASIIDTIQRRGYVIKEGYVFKPLEIGVLVTELLVKHFSDIVDITFTAKMEDQLDAVAKGEDTRINVLKNFYGPFIHNLETKEKELGKQKLTEQKTDLKCEKCNQPMIIKVGRYGKFLSCSGFPKCKNTQPYITQEINDENAQQEVHHTKVEHEQIARLSEHIKIPCPNCQGKLVLKDGRFGQFVACENYPKCKYTKTIQKNIGMKCPECSDGDVVEKKTKRGKLFWGCSNYPKCHYASWNNPLKTQAEKPII